MRVLVFSDSHGLSSPLVKVLELHPEAKHVLFLGDGERDMEKAQSLFPERTYVKVKGNCDFGSSLPTKEVLTVGGKKIYITHGYAENVKYSLDLLVYRALELKADIAVYGHTHRPESFYEDGLYIFNPGSAADGCYGMIDITPSGILCINARI